MKKFLLISVLIILIGSVCVYAKDKKAQEPKIQSTQGLEIDNSTSQKAVKSKEDKNPAKTKRKNRNKYLRSLNKTDRSQNRKRIEERDSNFLNQQLEIKKRKLEELNSQVKKGENQE